MDLHDAAVIQRVAMPTVMELHYGAAYTESEEEYRRVRNLLLMYPIVSIDEPTAWHAAELLAMADRQAGGDSSVNTEDALIGAVADRCGEPVLTANETDFRALGVDIDSY